MARKEERSHYRIVFPIQERPVFESFGVRFAVHDASEQGLKFTDPGDQSPKVHSEMVGRLIFRSGQECVVRGTVIRRAASGVVLNLTQPIPLPLIMEIQRDLLKRYKNLEFPEGS